MSFLDEYFVQDRIVDLTIRTILILAVFVFLNWYFRFFFFEEALSYTNASAYFSKFIFGTQINKAGFLASFLLVVLPLILFWKRIRWTKIELPYGRVAVLLFALPLTWFLTTYQYNFLYNQWHWIDRLFLFLSWGLMAVHPIFVLSFLVEAYTLLAQFNYGPGDFSTAFYAPSLYFLTLFVAYLYLKMWLDRLSSAFLVNVIGLQASYYFSTGWAKAWLGEHPFHWALTADLYLGFTWLDYIGWHWFFSSEYSEILFWGLKTFNRPLTLLIFFMEVGSVLFITSRLICISLLGFFSIFHVVTFVLLGVSFWPWMLTDIILICWILSWPNSTTERLFSRSSYFAFLLCLALVLSTGLTADNIGWWSVRSHYAFELHLKTEDGSVQKIDKTILAPLHRKFNFIFSQDYLIDRVILPSVVYDPYIAEVINKQLKTKEDFRQLKERYGIWRYDAQMSKEFQKTVEQFLTNYKNSPSVRKGQFYWITKWIHAPVIDFHYTHPGVKDRDLITDDWESLVLRLRQGFFNGRRNITVRTDNLSTIKF